MDNENESINENMELSTEEFYSNNYYENLEINEQNLISKRKGKINEKIIQLYSELKLIQILLKQNLQMKMKK